MVYIHFCILMAWREHPPPNSNSGLNMVWLIIEASFQKKWLHNQLCAVLNSFSWPQSKTDIIREWSFRGRNMDWKKKWSVNSKGKPLRDHVYCSHLCSRINSEGLMIAGQPRLTWYTRVGWGVGVSSDYSNYSSRICHSGSHLSPLSQQWQARGWPRPACFYRLQSLQRVCASDTRLHWPQQTPSHYFLLTMISMARRNKWRL